MNNDVVHVFHGTKNVFDTFDFSECGQHGGNIGAGCGMYFSTSKADTATYGDNILQCVLRLGRQLSNHDITLKPFDVGRIAKAAGYGGDFRAFADSFLTTTFYETDTDIIAGLVKKLDLTIGQITDALAECGYTHTEDHITPEDPDQPHYIVYDLSTIDIKDRMSIEG
jgi:hypothetical protein